MLFFKIYLTIKAGADLFSNHWTQLPSLNHTQHFPLWSLKRAMGGIFVWPHVCCMFCMIGMKGLLIWLLHGIMTNSTMHVASSSFKCSHISMTNEVTGELACWHVSVLFELLATVHLGWPWSVWDPAHGMNTAFRTVTWWKMSCYFYF